MKFDTCMHVDIEKPPNHLRFGAKVLKFHRYMHVDMEKPSNHLQLWSECLIIHYNKIGYMHACKYQETTKPPPFWVEGIKISYIHACRYGKTIKPPPILE